jgi:membrane-associated phospholipid phosphatase
MLIRDNKDFIIPFVVLTASTLIILGILGNDGLFLCVNNYYSAFADYFFLSITNLGDGIIAALFVIALLWVSFRDALIFLTITLLLAIVVTVLKNYIFPELDRPLEYFGTSEILRLVAGYHPPALSSFPSGHTATAFSVCLYLSFLTKSRYKKFTLFLIAFTVGYSRIYLSAHFPVDVMAGAFLAVVITILCYYYGHRINKSWLDKKISFRPKTLVREQTV